MFTIYLAIICVIVFAASVWLLGVQLRKHPSKESAEKSSRILHFMFFVTLGTIYLVGLFYPGLTHFDETTGLAPLPWRPFFLVLGILVAMPGLYYMGITNILLRKLGSGANAFRLTKRVVAEGVYKRTRNPMSLGYYLLVIAFSFVLDSTTLSLIALLGVIPSHIYFLKYFEELELELRHGNDYLEYKKSVPFLIPNFRRTS